MMILQILFQFIWIIVFVSRDVSGSYGKQVYIRTKLPALGVLSVQLNSLFYVRNFKVMSTLYLIDLATPRKS